MGTSGAATGDERRLLFPLLMLTFVTGLVDAVSFLGLGHVFTANMTGNVVLLGFGVAGTEGISVSRSLASLIAFLVGALAGGRLGAALAAKHRRWLVTVAVLEIVLLAGAAGASIGFNVATATPLSSLYAVIVLTAFAMGLRNATIRRLAVPDMTTTVLTLTLTGLAADSTLAGGANPRIFRRVASVLVTFAGAATGAVLVKNGLFLPLVLSSLFALTAALSRHLGERT